MAGRFSRRLHAYAQAHQIPFNHCGVEERKHLSLDEKAFHRGHEYASILTDLDAGRVIDLVESRTLEAASTLLKTALTDK